MKPELTRILIGNVYKPHGVKGELKVFPETDDPNRFLGLKTVFIGKEAAHAKLFQVQTARLQKTAKHTFVLLTLEGIQSPEDAELIKGNAVYADEMALPPLEENEFFLDDLLGMNVQTEEKEVIGKVVEWMESPAHDIMVVQRKQKQDALIPIIPEFLVNIDAENQLVTIRPIEGLLD
ncbi:MAG TPA: ribosome maturation factor RimM [Rhodothermales bacterium]|nr:ribosome maturation factor RimM [Rhodothermales bacterium]HRR08948.1 ribosome maturation factor RimM [Rhodothermales bacterium]